MAKGYRIHKIVKEYGSGLDDARKGLIKLLENQDFTKIIVEHKDRLVVSGFNYIRVMLEHNGIEVEVVNEAEDNEEDTVQDFVSIIASYCTRIYGKRRSKRKTEKLIEELKDDH
jgi:predicted site-specific integrase-resolvase